MPCANLTWVLIKYPYISEVEEFLKVHFKLHNHLSYENKEVCLYWFFIYRQEERSVLRYIFY